MSIITKETMNERLNWRYAVKKFDASKKISDADWEMLEQAMILAPSSFGLQPYKFILITDKELKEKIETAAYGQKQITDSSHLVVFAHKNELNDEDVDRLINRIVEVRGTPREMLAEYEGQMKNFAKGAREGGYDGVWCSRQTYLPLGFLLETAAAIGVDACPMEGFDTAQVDEILGLTDYSSVVICTLGYRDEQNDWLAPLPKVRFPKETLIDRR